MGSLKRCFVTKTVEKRTVFDFAEDGDTTVQCGRISGHTGTHSFIINKKRIGEAD